MSEAPEEAIQPAGLKFATADEAGVEDQEVPKTLQGIVEYGFAPQFPSRKVERIIAMCTQRMAKYQQTIDDYEKQAIYNFLKALNSLESFTAEAIKSSRVRDLLSNILGETGFRTKPFEYPEPLQRNAAIIRDRLDNDLAAEEAVDESEKTASSTSPEPRSTKKKGGKSTKSAAILPLPSNDPTFKHIMRGILTTAAGRRSYSLDPKASPRPRNCNVTGHNGLNVGQWWPLRVCAIRDGAHGAMQAGIAGGASTGAYSIVVSGQYADLDVDQGSTLHYSGSNSHSNTDPDNPILSYNTKAMRLSYTEHRPLRVIRSAAPHNRYTPSRGLRYDGLYDIVDEELRRNSLGGAFLRFKMVRRIDQPPIDRNRPDAQERRVWEAVRQG